MRSEEETNEQDTPIINMSTGTSTRELELQARIAELQQELVASRSVTPAPRKSGIQLRDLEGTINKFDGENPVFTVDEWIVHITECKEMYFWTDSQTLVSAKNWANEAVAKAMLYGKWTIDEFKRSLED